MPLVPERAIIAILPAVSLGFIGGIICSAAQTSPTTTLIVGIVAALLTFIAAFSSVFGVKGDTSEKAIVGILRALCAAALSACMFLFLLAFLRDGEPVRALPWFAVGLLLGLALGQMRVRDRSDAPDAQPAAE